MATVTRSLHDLAGLTPQQIRHEIRAGQWRRPTSGLAPGYTQANLAVVPRALAYDFLLFCQRNPKPCPLLEVLDPGDPEPRECAPGADIRTDLHATASTVMVRLSTRSMISWPVGGTIWSVFFWGVVLPSNIPSWMPVCACGTSNWA